MFLEDVGTRIVLNILIKSCCSSLGFEGTKVVDDQLINFVTDFSFHKQRISVFEICTRSHFPVLKMKYYEMLIFDLEIALPTLFSPSLECIA